MSVVRYATAGGVVLDDADRVLLIERDVERGGQMVHEVRLPKGHIEPGEAAADAAVREVCEESGYCTLEIVADLGILENSFEHDGRRVERNERYYLMRLADESPGQPRPTTPEEARFRPRWAATLDKAAQRLTFESEREFIRRAQRVLERGA
ncbi:MAG: NUDIX domain-containing protein [Ardenticatenaceae bacterium]|nr:NUDIX domain-containing protein [Ardenticatenaceae bacterium]HBY92967.1 hypothetical protein [Chloroflexota bacterium]